MSLGFTAAVANLADIAIGKNLGNNLAMNSKKEIPSLSFRRQKLRRREDGRVYMNFEDDVRVSIMSKGVTRAAMDSRHIDLITAAARLLWGRSLPPSFLISSVRSGWSAVWHVMMSQLAPSTSSGSYSRPAGAFSCVSPAARLPGRRLHLYAALSCPWAHRTLIVRALRSLEPLLPVSIVSPGGPDGSWKFSKNNGSVSGGDLVPGPDSANGRATLREVYKSRHGGYDGRSTVPMLWDVEISDIACNESYAIIEFLNDGIIPGAPPDLNPPELREEIGKWNRLIYPNINNGVYKCGFAQSQEAYDEAAAALFGALERVESHLASSKFLCGGVLTLADVCLFTTLIRFDLVYNTLFKCTRKKLIEFPNLHAYTRNIYQIPKVAETCNLDAIMEGYFRSLFPLNPGGIQPELPAACSPELLRLSHGRETMLVTPP